jgi:hypothetical protein
MEPKNDESTDGQINVEWLRRVIDSFDRLSILLGPEEEKRPPTSLAKVSGEIKPRTKTLQQIFRSVRISQLSVPKKREISCYLGRLKSPVEDFLHSNKIRDVLEGAGDGKNATRLKRQRDGISRIVMEGALEEMHNLEMVIEGDLLRIDGVLWPRRM